jgi:hypothetical protein
MSYIIKFIIIDNYYHSPRDSYVVSDNYNYIQLQKMIKVLIKHGFM